MLFRKSKPVKLGECCKEMSDALTVPHKSHFFQEDNGILYVTIGAVQVDEGTAWLDQALLFCRFCGTKLQTAEQIKELATLSDSTTH